MKEKKSPSKTPFIISFIVIDLILLGIIIAFENKVFSGNGFFASLIANIWIILLIGAFLSLILSIILIKDYLNLRTALVTELMVFIFSLWFGVARVPLMNDNGEGHFVLFTMGSILLLVVNIAIQIDLLCAPKIKNFLTTDKKDREAEKYATSVSKAEQLFSADLSVNQVQKTQKESTHVKRNTTSDLENTTHFSTAQTRTQKSETAVNRAMPQNNSRRVQQPMSESELIQFRENQAKRRAARAAAAKALENSSVQFNKLTPPSGRAAQNSSPRQNLTSSQVESLFFKDEK